MNKTFGTIGVKTLKKRIWNPKIDEIYLINISTNPEKTNSLVKNTHPTIKLQLQIFLCHPGQWKYWQIVKCSLTFAFPIWSNMAATNDNQGLEDFLENEGTPAGALVLTALMTTATQPLTCVRLLMQVVFYVLWGKFNSAFDLSSFTSMCRLAIWKCWVKVKETWGPRMWLLKFW